MVVVLVLVMVLMLALLALLVALQMMEKLWTSRLHRQPRRPQRRRSMPSPTPSPLVVSYNSTICQRPKRWHWCPRRRVRASLVSWDLVWSEAATARSPPPPRAPRRYT